MRSLTGFVSAGHAHFATSSGPQPLQRILFMPFARTQQPAEAACACVVCVAGYVQPTCHEPSEPAIALVRRVGLCMRAKTKKAEDGSGGDEDGGGSWDSRQRRCD